MHSHPFAIIIWRQLSLAREEPYYWIIIRVDLIQFRRFRREPLKFDISRTKPYMKNPFDKFWGLNMFREPVKFCENRISSFREKRVTDKLTDRLTDNDDYTSHRGRVTNKQLNK